MIARFVAMNATVCSVSLMSSTLLPMYSSLFDILHGCCSWLCCIRIHCCLKELVKDPVSLSRPSSLWWKRFVRQSFELMVWPCSRTSLPRAIHIDLKERWKDINLAMADCCHHRFCGCCCRCRCVIVAIVDAVAIVVPIDRPSSVFAAACCTLSKQESGIGQNIRSSHVRDRSESRSRFKYGHCKREDVKLIFLILPIIPCN